MLRASFVDGCCSWSKHLPWHEHCPGDLAVVFQSDAQMEWGVRESDDVRPKREVLWRSRGANEHPAIEHPGKAALAFGSSCSCSLSPEGPCSDWEA
jgi:hypothetical protein